jgi:glycosyltransferase involved in cell wall biosynthesis
MPTRKNQFDSLISHLERQISNVPRNEVEVISDADMQITTGLKRNRLLQKSNGKFVVFIDDDDEVSHQYVSRILHTIKKNPKIDCIGISGIISFAGNDIRRWHISKAYGRWFESNNVYFRTPNHISPVKREIAVNAGFENISISEDFAYSMAILPHLKHEVKIKGILYHYKYSKPIQPNIATDGGIYRPAWR